MTIGNQFKVPQEFIGQEPELTTSGVVVEAYPNVNGQQTHRASISFINQGIVGGNLYLDTDGSFKIRVASLYDAPLATATPPQIFDLPLTSGFIEKDVRPIYGKDQFGTVHVSFKIVKPEGIPPGLITIAMLPEGYRPTGSFAVHGVCSHADFNGLFYLFYISILGDVSVVVHSAIPAGPVCGFAGSISFIAVP